MSVVAVIPARFASSRFPGKLLSKIPTKAGEKPIIQMVYERVLDLWGPANTYIATDSNEIREAAENFGAQIIMTEGDLACGTDRVAAAIGGMKKSPEIIVNIQADEPLVDTAAILKAVDLVRSGAFEMGTLASGFADPLDLEDLSAVKVLVDKKSRAVYFSRFAIPYTRESLPKNINAISPKRHIGVYVYTSATLERLKNLPVSNWEKSESLEQLRALENGIEIGVVMTNKISPSIDNPGDIEKLKVALKHG